MSTFETRKLQKGLYLEERAASYRAIASIDGTRHTHNTETKDLARAERLARGWFARLKAETDGRADSGIHTMHEAANGFLADVRKPIRQQFYTAQWSAIRKFFEAVDIDAIDTPMLKKFMRSRTNVKPITVRKNLVCIRVICKWAVSEGWLRAMPLFPSVGTLDHSPRPWFTAEEWAHLLKVAQKRIDDAMLLPGNCRYPRMDVRDFITLQYCTGMRVDELRSIKVQDVKIAKSTRVTYGGNEIHPMMANTGKLKPDSSEYLDIDLQKSKRGPHNVVTHPARSGVTTFRSLVKRKNLQPTDLLFDAHHRDAFRELLIEADLRSAGGMMRNLKSVRCTGIMAWVLAQPNANLKLLADNFGTSVQMLDQFYLKPLSVKMNRDALVG